MDSGVPELRAIGRIGEWRRATALLGPIESGRVRPVFHRIHLIALRTEGPDDLEHLGPRCQLLAQHSWELFAWLYGEELKKYPPGP